MEHEKTGKARNAAKDRRIKAVIGILLLAAVAYAVLTNFDLGGWPRIGVAVEGPGKTCTEIRGPKTMTDTVIEQLRVSDEGFTYIEQEDRATLMVRNIDDDSGEVKVTLYCRDGAQQGEQTKELEPGETAEFSFIEVQECDLDYLIEPETIKRRVEKTVYVTDSVCE